jgi:hypothetical protein
MKRLIIACMGLLLLAGCVTASRTSAPDLEKNVKWALLPMENQACAWRRSPKPFCGLKVL